jgi:hypothetical protein
MQREDLIDAVAELEHDLGKYLCLPLALLPRPAGPEDVRAALCTALLETRKGPRGVQSAEDLWRAFAAEAGPALRGRPAYDRLAAAVAGALAWRAHLSPGEAVERERVEADLRAVAEAIRALREEVEGEG